MRIEMSSGNFSLVVSGELSDDVKAALMAKGLKYELERNVLTKTYITLRGVPGKRKGKTVLPKDFERESVEYSVENAAAFHDAAAKELAKLGTFSVAIGHYVKGENTEARKRATGVFDKTKAKGEDALEKLSIITGYDGDIEDEAEFIEAIHEWLMSTAE